MVRKITPTAGGWGKHYGTRDHHHAFEQTATVALASLPSNAPTWRAAIIRTFSEPLARHPLSPALLAAFHTAIAELIDLETPHVPTPTTGPRSPIDGVAYRTHLRGLLAFQPHADDLLRAWITAMSNILRRIADAVPDMPPDALSLNCTVPFIDLVPASVDLVADVVTSLLHFTPKGPDAVVPGAVLASRVKDNLLNVSKLTEDAAAKNPHRLTSPKQSGLTGEALLAAYLSDTPFYDLLTTPVPFAIPSKTYAEHGAIFAKAGHGKTQTLRAITASLLQSASPPALFIMDSLGSLIADIDTLEIFATRLKDRLVIIDPTDPSPPALNFFKLQSDDLAFYLFKAIDQSFTQRQATMIAYLMELMRHIDGATLLTLVEVCESKDNLFPDAVEKLSPFARSFFENQFYARKHDQFVQQTKNQIAQRVYALGRMGKFAQMFSARENKFDALRCMREKKICIINTDARPTHLGGLGEASSILGRFILAQCLEAARSRPHTDRDLALIIVDEAKHYLDDQAALILSDARQFGLGMLIASQFPHQLPEGVRREINTNTSIKLMGPTEFAVASQYARDMFTTPESIMGVKSHDRSHAEWMAYVANLTNAAVKLSVPFGTIDAMPRMTRAEHDNLRAINRARYGIDADDSPAAVNLSTDTRPVRAPVAPEPVARAPQPRDFGKYENVTLQGITLNALLDTGAQTSVLIASHSRRTGTADTPRLSFTITTRDAAHTFERPITGTRTITGMHAATAQCPTVSLFVTLDGHRALEHFAVTVDPDPQAQPVILGESFFAGAPFTARISPTDSMLTEQRQQKTRG